MTYEHEENKKIAKIGAVWACGITALYLYDETGAKLFGYCPSGFDKNHMGCKYEEQEIAAGEELIGIHGIKDDGGWFTTIGLILLRKAS